MHVSVLDVSYNTSRILRKKRESMTEWKSTIFHLLHCNVGTPILFFLINVARAIVYTNKICDTRDR